MWASVGHFHIFFLLNKHIAAIKSIIWTDIYVKIMVAVCLCPDFSRKEINRVRRVWHFVWIFRFPNIISLIKLRCINLPHFQYLLKKYKMIFSSLTEASEDHRDIRLCILNYDISPASLKISDWCLIVPFRLFWYMSYCSIDLNLKLYIKNKEKE